MNVQRLQTYVLALLLIVCGAAGYSLYLRNREIAHIQNSLSSLQDNVRQSVQQKNRAAVQGDPMAARAAVETCGLLEEGQFPTAEDMNEVLPYLVRNEQLSTLVAKGIELADACADDSESQRILFLGASLKKNGRSEITFGALDEAYPQLGTLTTIVGDLNLLAPVSPARCAILGNGAVAESQFLVTCQDVDPATSLSFERGFVMDFVKRAAVEAYRCNDLQDDACHAVDAAAYQANKQFFDPQVAKMMQ